MIILVLTTKSGILSRKGWGGESKENFTFNFIPSIQFKFSNMYILSWPKSPFSFFHKINDIFFIFTKTLLIWIL